MGNYENLKQSITEVIRTNGNKEITGAVLQSTLLTIISTVGANATFAGIATPTTNPGTPDGSVFWIASEGGTYSNFGGLELQDGLSVLTWNGSWSSQQILSIDDEPTAGSDNLVKSGGVQEELALGAVYDVSAKNPTAGTNNDGKFESLSALLEDANLDTLIPVSVRKGGMSIKFVQSSGNKYVQYRLMKNQWSTTVSDWQGVDDEPITGSKNLVESGGVDKYTSQVPLINSEINNTIELEIGGVSPIDGSETTVTNRVRSSFIKSPFGVTVSDTYIITAIHYYTKNSNGTYSYVSNDGVDGTVLNIPNNNYYYRFIVKKTDDSDINLTDGIINNYTCRMEQLVSNMGSNIYNIYSILDNKISLLNSFSYDTLKLESGGLRWNGEEIDNSKRARTIFLKPPFTIHLNDGYTFKAKYVYNIDVNGSITALNNYSLSGKEFSVPFDNHTLDNYIYRATIAKEDDSDISVLTDIIKTYKGAVSLIDEGLSLLGQDVDEIKGKDVDEIKGKDVQLPTFISGYLINVVNNNLQQSSKWSYSEPAYLKAGTLVDIYTSGNNVGLLIEKRKENDYKYCILVGNDDSNFKHYKYLIPKDGEYILSYKTGSQESYISLKYYDVLNKCIQSDSIIKNLIQSNKFNGKIISGNTITSNTSYSVYSSFLVGVNDIIEIYTDAATDVPLIADTALNGDIGASILVSDGSVGTMKKYIYSAKTAQSVFVCLRDENPSSYVRHYHCGYYGTQAVDARKTAKDTETLLEISEFNTTWESGKSISANDMFVFNNASYCLSAPILVETGQHIYINSAGGGIGLICNSDAQGNLLSVAVRTPDNASTVDNVLYEYIVPYNGYIRVTYKCSIEGSFAKFTPSNIGSINHLKILLLGNSYGSDAWSYVPFILKQYGITCDIYMYWRGALSLSDLVTFWESDDYYDTSSPQAQEGAYRFLYHIDTRTQNTWETLNRKSAKDLVEMGGWNIITLLQWSVYTISNTMTNPYFEQVVDLIRQSLNIPYTLGWQMSWTRPKYNGEDVDKKQDNLDVAKLISKQHAANIIFPCATAIFNCRENQTLAAIGDSTYHNLWASDNVHLEEGLPCYIAALAIVQSLFNKYYPQLSVLGNTLRPNETNVVSWNVPQRQMPIGGVITSVTEQNCYLAQKAAIIANKYSYEINGV